MWSHVTPVRFGRASVAQSESKDVKAWDVLIEGRMVES